MGTPKYSDAALSVRDVFFGAVASVHFFVEDERLENLYEIVIEQAFPRMPAFKVFPLAGKQNVLQHANAGHAKIKNVTRVYLLDKDFDDVLGRLQLADGLFYLDHYCLENLLLDEFALLRVCVQERPRVRKSDLKRRLGYEVAIEGWLPLLDRLHRAFALTQLHELGIPNTDIAPEVFTVERDRSELCAQKVENYVGQVRRALILKGVIAAADQYEEVSRKVFGSRRLDLKRVNGKFLARLHYHRMKRNDLCGNIGQDSFVLRCAQGSELAGFRGVSRRVRAYIRAQGLIA